MDRGGVRPEPWHLSYAPLAQLALSAFTIDGLREALQTEGIDALEEVGERLPRIVERYVMNVEPFGSSPLPGAIPGTRRA